MPIYTYTCDTHGEFVELKPITKRNERTNCPQCNGLANRCITAPNLSIMTDTNRKAWQRNEKSMHEPKHVSHSHSHTCSHSHHASAEAQTKYKTARKNSRPWMLGH